MISATKIVLIIVASLLLTYVCCESLKVFQKRFAVTSESTKEKRSSELVDTEDIHRNDDNSFEDDEVSWANINDEFDIVLSSVLNHIKNLSIDHLQLPDISESIVLPLLIKPQDVGLYLTNGIAYNVMGVQRLGDASMTYRNKSFYCRFNLKVSSLQFDYDFSIRITSLEAFGKVTGTANDAVIHCILIINLSNMHFEMNDFRVVSFGNVHVQLNQQRLIRQLSGLLISPIADLFRNRIALAISDGIKDSIQLIMNDFNNKDPLELKGISKQMLGSLIST